MPISFDGTDVSGVTIDGEAVTEITMDGNVVWASAPDPLVWETETEWDNATAAAGVVHEATTNTDHTNGATIKMGYAAETPFKAANLVSYLPFHEDSGTTANDLSGNANDGSINGPTLGQSGLLGTTSYYFDGTDDYISQPVSSIFESTTPTFSISFWVNGEGAYQGGGWYDGTNDLIQFGNGQWRYGQIDHNDHEIRWTADESTWKHIVITFDGNTPESRVYYDASLIGSDSSAVDIPSVNPPDIGRRGGSTTYFTGNIADIRFYDTALTASEVQTLYDVPTAESYLTTATKSFSIDSTPDLQDLNYALNGQTITLDVIGSPGTASEETVTQTLGGATSYTLSWGSAHTDFRIRANLDTTDPTVTPTVSRLGLG